MRGLYFKLIRNSIYNNKRVKTLKFTKKYLIKFSWIFKKTLKTKFLKLKNKLK